MRATVLTDQALVKQAGRFVWLSIDTEDAKNAPYLEKFPWEAVPTFQVINPAAETVAFQWVGACDANELVKRFDEGEKAFHEASAKPAAPTGADSELNALAMADKNQECAEKALALAPTLPPGAMKANVVSTGLDCALGAKPEESPWRPAALTTLEAATKEALTYPGLLDDDRSALYGELVDARDRQDDKDGGKAAAGAWLDWLDQQAKSAPSSEARAALDGYRVSAAIRAAAPERVLASIQASERELPNDYNPPARLALVYREMGKYDDALAASDRALAKVYGPRKMTILDARATIYEKKGDAAKAKATLQEALDYAKTLPAPQQPKGMIKRIEKKLNG
ncbi:MAG TPA: tetratricopeptide repeat protein [Candidatus Polarisedimenticolaceae bacterium]|nr:tetratricopeptide repeat protein [Candidatus Polarisedimenticolaceae bacterium]